MLRQINSLLLSPTDKLRIQLSVGLLDSSNKPSYCTVYGDGNYLSISPLAQVKFAYIDKMRPWSRLDNVYITQRNIYGLRRDMKAFYVNLMKNADNIYQYGKDGYIISTADTSKYKRPIYLGNGQVIQLEPSTFYDEMNKPFPGVYMEINQKSNFVELSMEEFEAIYDLIQNIDIHREGMLLLQNYLILCSKDGGIEIPKMNSIGGDTYKPSRKDIGINVFERAIMNKQEQQEQKEMVIGPPVIKQPTSLEDLE